MPLFALNFLPNREYLNLLNVATSSNKSFCGETYLSVKKSYLLTFPHDKAEILAVCLSKFF